MLFKKGIEVEQYVGLKSGEVLPLSALISSSLPGFSVEPDQRNVEFVTPAYTSYDDLLGSAIKERMRLRNFLQSQNPEWTVVPGSALALPFEQNFIFSKPEDHYHKHIHERHGLSILTTSIHFNLGIDDPEELIRVVNLMRLEAPLILAVSASSPFYNGQVTGEQSYRWLSFPKVPEYVPFFASHADYINWTEQMLQEGQMYNVRHLWSAVRPNGPSRPQELDRLEVRIADLSTSWDTIMAIMAWIELRARYYLSVPDLRVSSQEQGLVSLSDENETLAAMSGINARFSDWVNQEETSVYSAFYSRLEEVRNSANELGLEAHLTTLEKILNEGNEASQKLEKLDEGITIEQIVGDWVEESLQEDLRVESICKAKS